MKKASKPHESSLVTGIDEAYNPFRITDFVTGYFGADRFWTVVVPETTPEGTGSTIRLIHLSSVLRLQSYAHWFYFGPDGRLLGAVDRPSPSLVAPELQPAQLAADVEQARRMPPMGAIRFYASPNPVKPTPGTSPSTTLTWTSPANQI